MLFARVVLTFASQLIERHYFFTAAAGLEDARKLIMITAPAMTFREWNGPLTADLVREPAKFGLGQVPSRLTAGCDDQGHLRLLLNGLRLEDSSQRWRGDQSHA